MDRHDPQLLNRALWLSLEWGRDWLQPIQARLVSERPDLARWEADELDAFIRGVREWAQGLAYRAASAEIAEDEARRRIREAHPWMSAECFSRLWSQGMYYAWKDGAR